MNTAGLENVFTSTAPRERAGSRTSNRFDFQKNWALCKLLTLHDTKNDYLLILDYHEDVVIFDSATNPQMADFIQVKTKATSNWTVASLIKRPSNKGASIFEKLYGNQKLFKDSVLSLGFVSNQALKVKLLNGTKSADCKQINFSELSTDDKTKFCNCIHEEGAIFSDWHGISKFFFRRTDLSLKDHSQHTTGRLANFLEKEHPDTNISATLAYKTISGEIGRKTNNEDSCSDFDELKNKKGISKDSFSSMLLRINQAHAPNMWVEVRNQLDNEHYTFSEIQYLKSLWTKYTVDRMDANNDDLSKLREEITSCLGDLFNSENRFSLRETVQQITPNLKSIDTNYYEEQYVDIAIICEAMHYETVQKVSQESKEESA